MKKMSFIAMLVMFSLVLGSFACVSADDISDTIDMVERTNEKIQATIDKAVEKADKDSADVDKIIDKLIDKTEGTADKMVEKAEAQGVTVVKEYVPVNVGGTEVMIDPCRVIGN